MLFGKEMAQPYIVFTGKKGRKCIDEIMTAKPVDNEYIRSFKERLARTEARIQKARTKSEKN